MPTRLPNECLDDDELMAAVPAMRRWLRSMLVLMGMGLIAVFAIASWLNPYTQDGQARRLETHLQLGLPPCTFKVITGRPCPACGMTTSFALLVRGDIVHSLEANCVGTLLAAFWLLLIPYTLVSALRGRYLLGIPLDWLLPRAVVVFCVIMLLRWAVVLWLG